MSYIDGFMAAVETARRDDYVAFAEQVDAIFADHGAARIVDGWADDIPQGKVTDFRKGVAAREGETVVFGWMEWADKATRDAAFDAAMKSGAMPRDMPYDGKRMVFGGFTPILDEGTGGTSDYVDGFLVPVPEAKREAYRDMAAKAWPVFREHGAVRHLEAWGDDVPHGTTTDFHRAVAEEAGENVVFSFIEWPDKATRDAAWPKLMADERMRPDGEMPFSGQRMFWGGFTVVAKQGG